VASIKMPDIRGTLASAAPKLSGDVQSLAFAAIFAEGFVKQFQDAGGQGIFIVAGLEDVHVDAGPLAVVTSRDGQSEKVEQMCRDLVQEILKNTSQSDAHDVAQKLEVRRKGDIVLFGRKAPIERYESVKPVERKDLLTPLDRLSKDNPLLSVVFCPGPDYRRVVRELWPELPGALAPLRGELADRWISLEGSISLPP